MRLQVARMWAVGLLALIMVMFALGALIDLAMKPSPRALVFAVLTFGLAIALDYGNRFLTILLTFGLAGLLGVLAVPFGVSRWSALSAMFYYSYLVVTVLAWRYNVRLRAANQAIDLPVVSSAIPGQPRNPVRGAARRFSFPDELESPSNVPRLRAQGSDASPMRGSASSLSLMASVALGAVTAMSTLVGIWGLVGTASTPDLRVGVALLLVPCASLLLRHPMRFAMLGAWLAGGGMVGLATRAHQRDVSERAVPLYLTYLVIGSAILYLTVRRARARRADVRG